MIIVNSLKNKNRKLLIHNISVTITNMEHIVLVDEQNNVLGTAPKLATHTHNTPLHRGFSVFLFNNQGQLLLQQRSSKKKTWPRTWSNSVCGHPMLDEPPLKAARRRLSFELGITEADIQMILPDYRYRFEKEGIVENEFCPVMVGFSAQLPEPNPDEVEAVKWLSWQEWLREVNDHPDNYSEWAVEETKLLEENKNFQKLLAAGSNVGDKRP